MKHLALCFFVLITLNSYSFSEEEVELEQTGCVLKGTLTTQDDPSKSTTLVVLIAGSGPTDRNGNNPQMKNNSLKMFSEMIVAGGHSCLRFDKRAIAESALTDPEHYRLSFEHFISDAVGWVDKYAADARFHNIVLAGHSQGSLVAMCAANQNENVDGVISLAGPGETIDKVLKWQLAQTVSIEIQGVIDAKIDTLAAGDTLKVIPDYLSSIFHPSIQPFLISWMKFDPQKEAKKLKVPMLIVNGTTDAQVKVRDAKLLKEAKEDADLAIVKKMNHVLKFCSTDSGVEQLEIYADPDIPLHKKLAKPVLAFIQKLNE